MAANPELEAARKRAEETSADEAPQFEDGFTLRTFVGLLFIAFVMLPGGIYLGLVAGMGIAAAAEWVTIVLFAEVMRRSYQPLKRQEIYVLFYMAAALTAAVLADRGLAGGPLAYKIWDQFFAQSAPAAPIVEEIPRWAIPHPTSDAITQRNLLHGDWWLPIALLAVMEVLGRASWMSLGYLMFRMTSDVERLPFPMAPVAASGALALAEAGHKGESWRWGVFSSGAVVGMIFGLVYIAVPVVSGATLGEAVRILPIPWWDMTTTTESILPAAALGFSTDLGNLMIGFVLPVPIVVGAALGSVLTTVLGNPILYHLGALSHWKEGFPALQTHLTASMDFWLAVGVGVQLSVAALGLWMAIKAVRASRAERTGRKFGKPPAGRGDPPLWLPIVVWIASALAYIAICRALVPEFPTWIVAVFALVWSPLNSYISARMFGLTGRPVAFPYLKEAAVITSRYQRADVWYAPLPLYDHGQVAQRFREVELTGTKFSSILKAEVAMLFVLPVASFVFWAFFWKTSQIPSTQFPYAQKFWPYHAQMEAVWKQINRPESAAQDWLLNALEPKRILAGFGAGLALYGLFGLMKLPLMFFYGFAGGVGHLPHMILPQLIGAFVGRRFFARRYGLETWSKYAPILLAGYACGAGLAAMLAISLALVAKSVSSLPF
ncbi:MAG: peptide transporter [Armatimonadetes bacterium]|nr:peptide transporter [Armatimonadota bacterium]